MVTGDASNYPKKKNKKVTGDTKMIFLRTDERIGITKKSLRFTKFELFFFLIKIQIVN